MPVRSAVLLLVMLLAGPVHANGTVFRASGCVDTIFVETARGFSVLHGSSEGVKEKDALRGDVEQIGQPTLFDETAGRSLFAQVAEINLTLPEVNRRIAVRCRSATGEPVVYGYVSRTTGCGSKIFVETPQGYAVLEQLAGGVVADRDTLSGSFNHPGRTTVFDRQSGSTITVFVRDLWLPKSAAERAMEANCRRQPSR